MYSYIYIILWVERRKIIWFELKKMNIIALLNRNDSMIARTSFYFTLNYVLSKWTCKNHNGAEQEKTALPITHKNRRFVIHNSLIDWQMLTISALNGMEPFKFGNTFNAENKIRFLDLHFLRQVKIYVWFMRKAMYSLPFANWLIVA